MEGAVQQAAQPGLQDMSEDRGCMAMPGIVACRLLEKNPCFNDGDDSEHPQFMGAWARAPSLV
jgi:hypothetical protein